MFIVRANSARVPVTAYTTAVPARKSVTAAAAGRVELWLAQPAARARFDAGLLEPAERAHWHQMKTERRRQDWETSRALLQHRAIASAERASLSHSAGFAALAVTAAPMNIGVDVEVCRPRRFTDLARVAFATAEIELLDSLGDDDARCAVFYELWTLKEACAKALDLPLTDALGRCCFAGWFGGGAAAHDAVPCATAWSAQLYAPQPSLRLAVVVVGATAGDGEVTLHEWPGEAHPHWPCVRRFAARIPIPRARETT